MKTTTILLPAVVIAIAAALSSIFIVDEREKALLLQFGQIRAVKEDPGLAFKIPLIQQVVRYDDRILSRDVDAMEVTPADDRRLIVTAFARYRIADVVRYRQALGANSTTAAEQRIDTILRARLREVLGSVPSDAILSSDRAQLAADIRDSARDEAQALGLDIIDVRLIRTDLPEQNLDATFARMRAEREREAADEIARGNEAAQRIRAQADRTVVETVSDARRQAEIIRGEADAQRNAIYADAFGRDPDFFEFYRSLNAYRQALQAGNSTLVMSPDNEFFTYLRDSGGTGQGGTSGAAPAEPAATEGTADTAAPEPAEAPVAAEPAEAPVEAPAAPEPPEASAAPAAPAGN
ncbi:protease modulator HflC [Frigidibacter oleivorans]|uniref:protease modulator HflC n=1 Tax=Frigidibacter oleivorans TaxID=2487129 RepID=UPI000F8C8BC7|nr:protease modulator HflC [Frigidibacter oleivorans]